MAYTKQTWTDGSSQVDAARMGYIEQGVQDAHVNAAAAQTAATDAGTAAAGKADKAATISDPTTQRWAQFTVVDDGSSSAAWLDRFVATYDPPGAATPINTFWLNEYGEPRAQPGRYNTVALRVFCADSLAAYATRDLEAPIFEVDDQRGTPRTSLISVHKDGRVRQYNNPVGMVFTLAAGQTAGDIPPTLPAGTLVVRRTT